MSIIVPSQDKNWKHLRSKKIIVGPQLPIFNLCNRSDIRRCWLLSRNEKVCEYEDGWCQSVGWDIVTFAAFLSSIWIVSAPDLKFTSSVKLSMIKFESGKSPIHLQWGSCSIWYSRFERQVPEYTIYLTLSTLLFYGLSVHFLSCSVEHPSSVSAECIVERRRLPLVVAVHSVQWRIVSRANQPPGAHVTIFSFSGSHYLAFPMYSMQPAIRKPGSHLNERIKELFPTGFRFGEGVERRVD